MFENRKSVNCKVIMPAKAFKINSEEDYDGFDVMCKRGRNCDCEYQNSGYCSCNGICGDQEKIGYVKPNSACRMYPPVGSYVIYNIKGEIITVTEEQAKSSVVFEDSGETL